MATGQQTDVLTMLVEQHNEARALLSAIEEATSPPARRDSFERLVRLLTIHATATEKLVYPALQQAGPSGESVVRARRTEDDQGKRILFDLQAMGVEDSAFSKAFTMLRALMMHHIANEEQDVVPLFRALTS